MKTKLKKQEKINVNQKPNFIICDCHGHAISIEHDTEYKQIYIAFWQQGEHCAGWKQRLREIWHILRYGHPYGDDVVLTYEGVNELIDVLKKIK